MVRIIKLKNIVIENFKCFSHKEIIFNKGRTLIKGKNGIGKTTIYQAIMYLLFDKDINGNSAKDVRPHGEDGKWLNNDEIVVSATFDIDGKEVVIKKVQTQKFVKSRETKEKVFKGNDNSFLINDIPKKSTEFKKWIEENICKESTFLFYTNAQSFYKLDQKKRRAVLLKMAGEIETEDILAAEPSLAPIKDMLADGTIDELITRSKSKQALYEKQKSDIPIKISTLQGQKVDIDFAELELSKKSLEDEIKSIDEQLEDSDKQYEDYKNASDEALKLKFDISDLEREFHEEERAEKSKLETKAFNLKNEIESFEAEKCTYGHNIDDYQKKIVEDENYIKKLADDWKEANERVFDVSSLICPYCKQEYQENKKAELKAEFEENRRIELEKINGKGNFLKNEIEKYRNELQRKIDLFDGTVKSIEDKSEELCKLEENLSEVKEVDITANPKYMELTKQLQEKEDYLSKMSSADESRQILTSKKQDLQIQLNNVISELAKADSNNRIDERTLELQEEQKEISQKIADEQKALDLLEKYNNIRMNILESRVNQHFKMAKFKLFEKQLNGEYADVCKVYVNGTDREKGLNDSDCLLADIDILSTFQKMNDIQLPLFSDRAESINDERIPDADFQLVLLKVSDDKELMVE